MFRCLSYVFILFLSLLFLGCSAKLEIININDNAFIRENLPIYIDTKNSSYPLLAETIKDNLIYEIKKDGFEISEQNASYRLNLDVLSHKESAYRRYEPIYHYHTRCNPRGECYQIPRVVYVPCLDVMQSLGVSVEAANIQTNSSKDFLINSREFADSCARISNFGYYNNFNNFYSERFLFDSIGLNNIRLIAKKIKMAIFPIQTIRKETLLSEVKSVELTQTDKELFKKSYKAAANKNYQEAISGFERLKELLRDKTPYEVYLNLGLLYEYTQNLDASLQNYKPLADIEPGFNSYIERIGVKKRYEKR